MWKIEGMHMKIIKTCNLYLSFFTLGLSISLTGPCLLDLQHKIKTDTQHIALIYTARSSGYLAGAIFGGILLDIMKSKQAVLTACNILVTITMFGIPWSRNIGIMMMFMIINGVSLGAIETGGNVVCLQLWGKKSDPFFQALHFCFGLGGLISPLIAAPFLGNHKEFFTANSTHLGDSFFNSTANISDDAVHEVASRIVYPFSIVGSFALLVSIQLLVVCIISPTEDDGEVNNDKESNSNNRSCLLMPATIIVIFLLFFVVAGTEIGFGQTLTTYAAKGRLHVTTTVGSYMTSAFWAAFTISRLASVFLSMKFSNITLIISDICIIAVSALMLLFLMPNEWTLWAASIIFGAGVASSYGALVGWVGTYINITNKISAIFTIGCAAGEMVLPFIIAYFMESIPEMFAYVTAASCILGTGLLLLSYCLLKSGKKDCPSKEIQCYVISTEKVVT